MLCFPYIFRGALDAGATQINEATLTFIPKIIAIVVVLLVMAPWMLEILKQYTTDILGNVQEWIR